MFGTLNLQPTEALQFVENPDLGSALSRNRRDKPRVSCFFCRSRKVRCTGEATGCEKCISMNVECCYPSRQRRTKKPSMKLDSNFQPLASDEHTRQTQSVSNSRDPSRPQTPMSPMDGQDTRATTPTSNILTNFFPQAAAGEPMSNEMALDVESPRFPQLSPSAPNFDLNVNQKLRDWLDRDNSIGDEAVQLDDFTVSLWEELNNPSYEAEGQSTLTGSTSTLDSLTAMTTCFPDATPNTIVGFEDMASEAPSLRFSSSSSTTSPRRSPQQLGAKGMSGFVESPLDYNTVSKRLSTMMPNNDYTRQPREKGCQCQQSSVKLLEELGAGSVSCQKMTIDVLLGFLRESLKKLGSILDCLDCKSLIESNMLLAILANYLSMVCEEVVICFVRGQKSAAASASASASGPPSSSYGVYRDEGRSGSRRKSDEVWLSNYRIDEEEKTHILTTLISVHLTDFLRMLKLLYSRANRRSGQVAVLTEAGKRYKNARSILKKSQSRGKE